MKILVLDTIHGGTVIGAAFEKAGCTVDLVDVYRDSSGTDAGTARATQYDLVVAPVHLDPDHPLVRSQKAPVISHHEAVRILLGDSVPRPMIEITGARGKTTTAHALATLLPGAGVLLSSRGLILYPEQQVIGKMSITPASVLPAAGAASDMGGFLIAEESLGITGAGDLAILTSGDTYRCAAGKKDALEQKLKSLRNCSAVLLAPGVRCSLPGAVRAEDHAAITGTTCTITTPEGTGSFDNALLLQDAYRIPLVLAGTAACLLGLSPEGLSRFSGLEGRMSVAHERGLTIVDNANSGTNGETTVAAARFARSTAGTGPLTLVIGIEPGDGKVCEGFPDNEIVETVCRIRPDRLVIVGPVLDPPAFPPDAVAGMYIHRAPDLAKGREAAVSVSGQGSVVLAVKTWR
jgi:hypothetical protein